MVRNFAEYMGHFTAPPKRYKVYLCTILHKPISNSSLVTALQLKANLMHPPFCHFTLKKKSDIIFTLTHMLQAFERKILRIYVPI
jgi:hypothetical protein